MTAVPYHEMVGSVRKPAVWRGERCHKCRRELLEVAEGCWTSAVDQSAQCPAGGWHKP